MDTVTQRHKTHTLPNQSDMQNYPPCTNLNESQCVYELHTRLVKIAKMATDGPFLVLLNIHVHLCFTNPTNTTNLQQKQYQITQVSFV